MKSIFAFLMCAFTAAVLAQPAIPVTTEQAFEALAVAADAEPNDQRLYESLKGQYPVAWVNGRCSLGLLAMVDNASAAVALPAGVHLGAERGGIVSLRVDLRHLDVVGELPFEVIELAGRAQPHLTKSIGATRVDSVHAGWGLPEGYHGENVLIGVVDWGFDYTHPMFFDTTLTTSRVRAVWDQWRQGGPGPAEFGYGTEAANSSDIASLQSDTANVYSYGTHGTHVAGIAGGSGAGTSTRGMAPAAELLFATFLVDAAAAMDAFAWMQSIAEADGKRLVINMSWGLTQIGSRDGNSLVNQFIDALSEEGVVFTGSAGNNGDYNFHLDHAFDGDTLRSRVEFYPASANPAMWGQDLTLWGEPGEPFSAGFSLLSSMNAILAEGPWLNTAEGPFALDTLFVHEGDTVLYTAAVESEHPVNNRPFIRMRIHTPPPNRGIALKVAGQSGQVHAWNTTHLSNGVGNWGQDLFGTLPGWFGGNPAYGIGDPASTESVITVAAYRAEYFSPGGTALGGEVAYFTTQGPTLDERMKPDLAAPGVQVTSSVSSFSDANFSVNQSVDFNGITYDFASYSGTSMSAPTVAGIVALLLEADPTLTPASIRDVLKMTARTDDETGDIPAGGDPIWGMGKVNAYRAMKEILGVTSASSGEQPKVWRLGPNPAGAFLTIQFPRESGTWRLVDATGRVLEDGLFVPDELLTLFIGQHPRGAYFLEKLVNGKREAMRLVFQ